MFGEMLGKCLGQKGEVREIYFFVVCHGERLLGTLPGGGGEMGAES